MVRYEHCNILLRYGHASEHDTLRTFTKSRHNPKSVNTVDNQLLEMRNHPVCFNIRSKSHQFAAVWDFLPASTAVAAELPVPVVTHSNAMGFQLWYST